MATSEWTKKGHRIDLSRSNPVLVTLTVETQFWLAGPDGPQNPERKPWALSKLGFLEGTARYETERLVEHWLAFYGDAELTEFGTHLVREFFESIPLRFEEPVSASPELPEQKLN